VEGRVGRLGDEPLGQQEADEQIRRRRGEQGQCLVPVPADARQGGLGQRLVPAAQRQFFAGHQHPAEGVVPIKQGPHRRASWRLTVCQQKAGDQGKSHSRQAPQQRLTGRVAGRAQYQDRRAPEERPARQPGRSGANGEQGSQLPTESVNGLLGGSHDVKIPVASPTAPLGSINPQQTGKVKEVARWPGVLGSGSPNNSRGQSPSLPRSNSATLATMSSTSARPPMPTSPQASRLLTGGTTRNRGHVRLIHTITSSRSTSAGMLPAPASVAS